jgi:hypothetical protein
MLHGIMMCAFHRSMPFGATSSVRAWHRVGALLAHLARKLLFLPVLRYVDDYFSCERCAGALSVSGASFALCCLFLGQVGDN